MMQVEHGFPMTKKHGWQKHMKDRRCHLASASLSHEEKFSSSNLSSVAKDTSSADPSPTDSEERSKELPAPSVEVPVRSPDTAQSKRKVSFNPMAFVVLIPTADEYHNAGLGEDIWWNDCDFRDFKLGAMDEIKQIMLKYPELEAKDILKKYYDSLSTDDASNSSKCRASSPPYDKFDVISLDDPTYPSSPNSVAEEIRNVAESSNSSSPKLSPMPMDRNANIIERMDSVDMYRHYHNHHHPVHQAASNANPIPDFAKLIAEENVSNIEYERGLEPEAASEDIELGEEFTFLSTVPSPAQQAPYGRKPDNKPVATPSKSNKKNNEEESAGEIGLIPAMVKAASSILYSFVQSD